MLETAEQQTSDVDGLSEYQGWSFLLSSGEIYSLSTVWVKEETQALLCLWLPVA